MKRIPGVDTLGDLIDRLIVEVNKLAYFENKKREEHAASTPDVAMIAKWDNLSRDCCEYRSLLKSRINEVLGEIVASGEYQTLREARTFRPPAGRLADAISGACSQVSENIAKSIEEDLCIA
jgi:hypothetical protein